MKRIVIAGKDSYIGTKLAQWLPADRFICDTVDMKNSAWKALNFSAYDAFVLVAGIAHIRETQTNRPLFDAVNYRLAVEAGEKAKRDGIPQFVFFSSMSVYGLTVGHITQETQPHPNTAYGESKLRAEIALQALATDSFHVAILRPPMIYGPACRGNYMRLSRMIRSLPVFPYIQNRRSMLFISTLCGFMENLLESGEGGLYFPQNESYVSTAGLAAAIAVAHGKRLWQPRGFGWLLSLLSRGGGTVGKVFGSLTYDLEMSKAFAPAGQIGFEESIRETEAVG